MDRQGYEQNDATTGNSNPLLLTKRPGIEERNRVRVSVSSSGKSVMIATALRMTEDCSTRAQKQQETLGRRLLNGVCTSMQCRRKQRARNQCLSLAEGQSTGTMGSDPGPAGRANPGPPNGRYSVLVVGFPAY